MLDRDRVLDPDAEAYLRVLAAAPAVPQTVEGMRAAYAEAAPGLSGPGEPVAEVRDERLGGVPVRRYRPEGARGTTVWVHGGGWVVGSVETHDALCRALAVRSGSTVVSVDYDLAPQARHPVQVEQVLAVLAAVPAGEPVALAGDSAGAHLATLAACRAPRPVAGLALVYPVVSPRLDTPSAEENATGRGLTTQGMRWYWEQYLGDDDVHGGGTADLLEADLHGLPPALVLTAGHDPLRDEGLALADALEAAGREVRRVAYDGQVHGFFRMTAVIGQAREAQQQVADFLAEALAGLPGPA